MNFLRGQDDFSQTANHALGNENNQTPSHKHKVSQHSPLLEITLLLLNVRYYTSGNLNE